MFFVNKLLSSLHEVPERKKYDKYNCQVPANRTVFILTLYH